MKVKGTPVKYDLYGRRKCYHVTLFDDEIRMLVKILYDFVDNRSFRVYRDQVFSKKERCRFDEALTELSQVLWKIDNACIEHTGEVVPCETQSMYEVRAVCTDRVVFQGTHQECASYVKEALGLVLDPNDFRIQRAKGGGSDA